MSRFVDRSPRKSLFASLSLFPFRHRTVIGPAYPFKRVGDYGSPMLQSQLPSDPPLFMEPTEAWRAWAVDLSKEHRGPLLRSITYRTRWPERTTMSAHCLAQFRASLRREAPPLYKHSCPDSKHKCGIYALKDEEDVLKWATTPSQVAGRVRLWGRVFLYEKGYIAEYAYPLELTYRANKGEVNDDIWHMLGEKYGVEVRW